MKSVSTQTTDGDEERSMKSDMPTPSVVTLIQDEYNYVPRIDVGLQTPSIGDKLNGVHTGIHDKFDRGDEREIKRSTPLCCRQTDDETHFWSTYTKEAGEFDKELLEKWNKSLDVLLIFAGLFSAVNTAFIIESYRSLQPDQSEITNALLRLLLVHRHDDITFSEDRLNALSQSAPMAVSVNSMFFSSLACSLMAAFGAVTAKQWLTEYSSIGHMLPPHEQGRRRQEKYDGMTTWHFWLLMELMPVLLQLSLFLFLIGVIRFLWPLSHQVTAVVIGVVSMGLTAYAITVAVAVVIPTSPFQTPLSKHTRMILHSSASLILKCCRKIQLVPVLGGIRYALSYLINSIWLKFRHFPKTIQRRWHISYLKPSIIRANLKIWWKGARCEVETGEGLISWDRKDIINARCVLWLLEQAEHPDVTLSALNTVPTLPPNLLLSLFKQKDGLFERLLRLHESYLYITSESKSTAWSSEAILTGHALCHVLKARSPGDYSFSAQLLPLHERWSSSSGDLMISKFLRRLARKSSQDLSDFPPLLRQTSLTSVTRVSTSLKDIRHSSAGIAVLTHLSPFKVLLDDIIYSSQRHRQWSGSSKVSEEILLVLASKLEDSPPIEITSHIAIAVAAIQWSEQNTGSRIDDYSSRKDKMKNSLLASFNAIDKGTAVVWNVTMVLSLLEATSSNIIPRICDILLSLTENRFYNAPVPTSCGITGLELAQCLFRLSQRLPHSVETGRRVLRLLRCCPTKDMVFPLDEEYGNVIDTLLKHAFSEFNIRRDTVDMSTASYFLNWLATALDDIRFFHHVILSNTLDLHLTAVISLCQRSLKGDPSMLPAAFMEKILGVSANQISQVIMMQLEFVIMVLTASELDLLPDSLYDCVREFLNGMMECESLQWPPYFITAEIIAPGSAGRACSTRVEANAFIVGGYEYSLWSGESLLLLWCKYRQESASKAFVNGTAITSLFKGMTIRAVLAYYELTRQRRYEGVNVDIFREYFMEAVAFVKQTGGESDDIQHEELQKIVSKVHEILLDFSGR